MQSLIFCSISAYKCLILGSVFPTSCACLLWVTRPHRRSKGCPVHARFHHWHYIPAGRRWLRSQAREPPCMTLKPRLPCPLIGMVICSSVPQPRLSSAPCFLCIGLASRIWCAREAGMGVTNGMSLCT